MSTRLLSRWFVCGALLSLVVVGCSEEPVGEDEPLDVEEEAAALKGQWVQCAKEGAWCSFAGTHRVRYGRTRYTIRTFTGGVKCDAATFGTSRRSNAHCDVDQASADPGAAGSAAGGGAGSGAAGAAAGSVSPAPVAGSGAAGSVSPAPVAGSGGSAAGSPAPVAGKGGAGGAGAGGAGAGGNPAPVAGKGGAGGAGAGGAGAGGGGGSTPTAAWPGANGKSGVQGDPVLDRASVEAFCNWRGRACGVGHTYTARDSWDSMTRNTGWVFDNFAGFPGLLVISQGLVPNGRAADMQACANGTYDQHWRDFGTTMVNKGRAASVVRLGWEFNGSFMPWAGTNATLYKQCFQHAAAAIRQTNPQVLIDWTINAHSTPSNICGGSSLNCYPGDAYVDIIGIDNYDHAPSATSLAEFNRIAEAPEGMTWLFNFAKQHGKKFSVGEWGVAPGSDWNTSGENPEFIRYMHQWFAAHAEDLVFEAYFNGCIPNDVESNLFRPVSSNCMRVNNSAGSLYKTLFGR